MIANSQVKILFVGHALLLVAFELIVRWPELPTLQCTLDNASLTYAGGLKSSRPNNEKMNIISKLNLFFSIISLKNNTFIPAVLQRHYPVTVVVLRKICKIPLHSCNRLLIRRKPLTSEEEFEFWEETEVRGSQIWEIGWMFQQFIVQIP